MKAKKILSKLTAVSCAAVLAAAAAIPSFAYEFVDVAVTSPYKTSFDELYALGIINGYEDGTIRPENNITRAEVTKMVVAAMGPSYTEAAQGAAGIDTEFYDVPGGHWAAGYISTGVANGFINGNGDGTFDPESNVTYAQIVKMIVCAMGYSAICQRNGGWPNGYLTVAASIGVTSGVNVVGADTVVTRGQVAMLLNNALDIPIVDVTGYEESAVTGQLIAKTDIMDDINGYNAKDYQTLLTKNHKTYKVKGRITATKRSDSSLDADEVKFSIESTNNFDDIAYGSSYSSPTVETMKYRASSASEYMFAYGEALIAIDNNNDYEILNFAPYGTNDFDTMDTSLFDEYVLSGGQISTINMYVSDDSSKTKKFKMEDDFKVYINGVEQSDEIVAINKYLDGNDMGKVTFIDATDTGKTSTNGKYDYVLISYYADAIVDTYSESNGTLRIYFKDGSPELRGSMKVDLEDEDISLDFVYGNSRFDYTQLQTNDVLSIAYDVGGGFEDSSFYDVYVSREVVEGRVMSERTDSAGRTLYTINNAEYAISSSMSGASVEVGTNYTLYLNAFGKIVKNDESSSNALIGIVERVYKNESTDDYSVKLITNTGTKVTYTAKDSAAYNRINALFATMSGNLESRIVEYTINSAGYITNIEQVKAIRAERVSYRKSSNKLGSYSLSDSTVVIDLTDSENNVDEKNGIANVSRKSVQSFVDDGEYDVVLAERSSSDSTYRFVYVFGGSEIYTADTMIAVFDSTTRTYDDYQGSQIDELNVYTNGQESTTALKVASGYKPSLTRGDVFVYSTDSDGYVNEVIKLFSSIGNAGANYETFLSAVMIPDYKTRDNCNLYASFLNMPDGWANTTTSTKTGKVDVIFAPIVNKNGNNVTLAKINNSMQSSEVTDYFDYYVPSNANIYVYDFTEKRESARLSGRNNIGSVQKTNIPNSCKLGSEREIVDWKSVDQEGNSINFMMAKVVDGDIDEALVILGNKDSYSSSIVSRYTVTATNCTVSKTSAASGDIITITPNTVPDGKVLEGIYVNGTKLADDATTFTMPAKDTVVEVRFTDMEYSINIPEAETVYYVDQVSAVSIAGETITITVVQKDGYETKVTVTKELGGLVDVAAEEDGKYGFTMPASNVNISVSYISTEYQINVTGCTVKNADGAVVTKAAVGTQLTIVTEEGKIPSSIKVDGVDCSDKTFDMPAKDVSVVVEYPAELETFAISAVDCITSLTTAKAGDIVTVSYVEPENKVIEKITVNGSPIQNDEFIMPANDVTVVAEFIDPLYSLTASNCTLSASSARANDSVVVSYTLPDGKALDKILVNGNEIAGNTFIMPAANTTVEAVFIDKVYTLTADGCTVSASTAKYGDRILVSYSQPNGMVLDKITVNNAVVQGNEFTMPAADVVVKVTFTEAVYRINVGAGCTSSKTVAKAGETVSISSSDVGKTVEKISVNGTVMNGDTFTMPAADVTVEAVFSTKEYSIKTDTGCTADKTTAKPGDTVTVKYIAIPNGKVFDTFTLNGKPFTGSSFEMPSSDVVVGVVFKDMTYAITAQNCTVSKAKAAAGESITVSYTEPEGKVIDKLTLNGEPFIGNIFTMPAKDSIVIATFKNK